jgi:hypothetical protein
MRRLVGDGGRSSTIGKLGRFFTRVTAAAMMSESERVAFSNVSELPPVNWIQNV